MSELICLKQVSKVYPDGNGKELHILRQIQHSFTAGQSYSVIGRSGSGKSTLLHILGGLDHPTQGEVIYLGAPIFKMKPDDLADWRSKALGFVFQAHHLLPDFTALENTMIPQLILGAPNQQAKARAITLLDRLGLAERLHHKPSTLSGGEQQRVAIARALVNQPQLVLADEPTGNLDPQTGKIVAELLAEICAADNRTLILVTHSPDLAEQMNHKIHLEQGQMRLPEE